VGVVVLGLGANLGDRLAALQSAVDGLAARGVVATDSSRVWESEPVGGPDGQPAYLNAVIRARTGLGPEGVLEACRSVEEDLGRVREVRWGPRTIDVDVLLIEGVVRSDHELTVPHPRMHERAFVLLPLLEIDPNAALPDGTRVIDLPPGSGAPRPFAPPLRVPS
jgi:2-amino-4-hydroxy-6-hydroxymethyldihydropteridine diphosphokinase